MKVRASAAKWKAICATFTKVVAHDAAHSKAFALELGARGPDLAETVAASMAEHFVEDVQYILKKWGHKGLAKYLKSKLPITNQGKSGDFGEIVATEILREEEPDFEIPINRLCWKDCPLPMRGDDILGFDFAAADLKVLKAEVKSGASVSSKTVAKARAALNKNNGAPSGHSLGFIMERLIAAGRESEAEIIGTWLLGKSLTPQQITHCIFVVSGNANAVDSIKADAVSVKPPFTHFAFALHVGDHQTVVKESYTLAVKDA
jgi:hypothetical protein